MDLIRSVWEEARDLVQRLEGTTVRRFSVQAGETKIEIERTRLRCRHGSRGRSGGSSRRAGRGRGAASWTAAIRSSRRSSGRSTGRSAPGAKPFVEEGDVVDEGQTVAIVEAMKLMNQVKADQAGKVSQILVSDGDWVEFEQPLILLEPRRGE